MNKLHAQQHGKKPMSRTEIFKHSMGARNRTGIGLSYRPPCRLHSLAESVPWNRFLGSLKVKKLGLWLSNCTSVHLSPPAGSTLSTVIFVFAYVTCKYIVVERCAVVRMWIRPFLSIPKACVMLRFVAVPTNTVIVKWNSRYICKSIQYMYLLLCLISFRSVL
jgi:hypothetical protein